MTESAERTFTTGEVVEMFGNHYSLRGSDHGSDFLLPASDGSGHDRVWTFADICLWQAGKVLLLGFISRIPPMRCIAELRRDGGEPEEWRYLVYAEGEARVGDDSDIEDLLLGFDGVVRLVNLSNIVRHVRETIGSHL